MIPWAFAACLQELPEVDDVADTDLVTYTAADLWDEAISSGTGVRVVDLVVSSGRVITDNAFYAQHAAGGPSSGVRVELADLLQDWPPPVGTPIELVATYERRGGAPVLVLATGDSTIGTGFVAPHIVDWTDDPTLQHALMRTQAITVTSARDPLGHADTSGPLPLGGEFGLGPGFGRRGSLAGVLHNGRLSPRSPADWTGELPGDPPQPATLDTVPELAEGTPVSIDELLVATPWSRDGRWAVLQDTKGLGIWVDGETWGLPALAPEGVLGQWEAEVRGVDTSAPILRAWTAPEALDAHRDVVVTDSAADGAVITFEITELGPVDVLGERDAGTWLLDDRFVDLDGLQVGDIVVGAVRGSNRLAVF